MAEIRARANDPFGTAKAGIGQVDADRDYLLALVGEQQSALDRVGAGAWDAAAWEARERGLFYTAEFNALIALNPYRAALAATEDGK